MKILVIGEPKNLEECKAKFGTPHTYSFFEDHREVDSVLNDYDVVFDFILDEDPFQVEVYAKAELIVFLNTATISLIQLSNLVNHQMGNRIVGFNGMPTFLNQEILEVSILKKEDEVFVMKICDELQTKYLIVDDRVGLVTPRIICMIINEAYYTVQEGTATREDIDKAMKLGTNYPFGPFEWCNRIGIRHVYELLEAVYEDTRDERYKVCALLKREYLETT